MAKVLNIARPVVGSRIILMSDVAVRAPVTAYRPVSGPGPSTPCLATPKTTKISVANFPHAPPCLATAKMIQISVAKRPHAPPSPAPPFDDEIGDSNTPTPKRKQRKVNYAVSCSFIFIS